MVLKHLDRDLLYARVDFVESKKGPMMIELELTDPMLFLLTDPLAPPRFADAIKDFFN